MAAAIMMIVAMHSCKLKLVHLSFMTLGLCELLLKVRQCKTLYAYDPSVQPELLQYCQLQPTVNVICFSAAGAKQPWHYLLNGAQLVASVLARPRLVRAQPVEGFVPIAR